LPVHCQKHRLPTLKTSRLEYQVAMVKIRLEGEINCQQNYEKEKGIHNISR